MCSPKWSLSNRYTLILKENKSRLTRYALHRWRHKHFVSNCIQCPLWSSKSTHGELLPHRGQMAQNNIYSVYGIGADWLIQLQWIRRAPPSEDLMQHVPADQWHEFNGDLEQPVLPTFTWQCHIQVHLQILHKFTLICFIQSYRIKRLRHSHEKRSKVWDVPLSCYFIWFFLIYTL